jgi:hypothetical protein
MERVPLTADSERPHSARVYDYLLGGKDNYEVDRMVAHRMLQVAPDTRTLAWFSRQFLVKSVRMALDAGVRQFVDLGAGIPTSPNVHEVAREVDPAARVVYVDYDPVVYAHCEALLAGSPGVSALRGDVRDPDDIIGRLEAESLIDPLEPVAVSAVGVLHFVMDSERPADIVARFRDWMAPGSQFAITHGSTSTDEEFAEQMTSATDNTPSQVILRTPAQMREFFDGFDILEPGVVPLQQWLEDGLPATQLVLCGVVGRKS